MKRYNDVMVGNGALRDAIERGDHKAAKTIYKDTEQRAIECYGIEDYRWFVNRAEVYRSIKHGI